MTTKAEAFNDPQEYKAAKIIARNTFSRVAPNGDVIIRLHKTDIVTIRPDGSRIFNSANWRTPTTKDRMNTYGKVRIYQNKGLWYLDGAVFFDGITLDKDGRVTNPPKADTEAKLFAQKKKILAFVHKLDKGELPRPSSGDCWLCRMRDKNGKPMGEPEHVKEHVKEGYMHGSLLVNAMRFRGFDDRQISLHYSAKLKDTFKRAVRKYLSHIYGFAV